MLAGTVETGEDDEEMGADGDGDVELAAEGGAKGDKERRTKGLIKPDFKLMRSLQLVRLRFMCRLLFALVEVFVGWAVGREGCDPY